jgi:hypothetical protein
VVCEHSARNKTISASTEPGFDFPVCYSAGMVELLVMDEKSFQGWKNHLPATALYSSGRLNHASVNLQLASTAGKYYFVVSNRASPRSAAVQSKLNLNYRIR